MWQLLESILVALGLGAIAGPVVGVTGGVLAFGLGLTDDLLLLLVGGMFTLEEQLAFAILVDEAVKVYDEISQETSEDDDEREARARVLARNNPDALYLWGNLSVDDVLLTAAAGKVLYESEVVQNALEVAGGLLL